MVEWSRALDVRLSEWCCSVSIRGGFRGGVRGVRPPPKIRKAYVIQR